MEPLLPVAPAIQARARRALKLLQLSAQAFKLPLLRLTLHHPCERWESEALTPPPPLSLRKDLVTEDTVVISTFSSSMVGVTRDDLLPPLPLSLRRDSTVEALDSAEVSEQARIQASTTVRSSRPVEPELDGRQEWQFVCTKLHVVCWGYTTRGYP